MMAVSAQQSSDKQPNWLTATVRQGRCVVHGYRDFYRSRHSNIDIDNIQTMCMALGPYRNLTTLTGGSVFLHPHVQVLNHAARRVFPVSPINFLANYTQTKFDNFLKYAVYISQTGRSGAYGGSITLSHAFKRAILQETYQKRYGEATLKEDIHCLYWKDSMRVTNYIREKKVDLSRLLQQNDRLRFLLPIRYPPDCALSNIRTDHVRHFKGIASLALNDVVDHILHIIKWFLEQQKQYPDHFFHFFENEVDATRLQQLAHFLKIEPVDSWIEDTLACYQLKAHYEHPPELIHQYHQTVETLFGTDPTVMDKFKQMD